MALKVKILDLMTDRFIRFNSIHDDAELRDLNGNIIESFPSRTFQMDCIFREPGEVLPNNYPLFETNYQPPLILTDDKISYNGVNVSLKKTNIIFGYDGKINGNWTGYFPNNVSFNHSESSTSSNEVKNTLVIHNVKKGIYKFESQVNTMSTTHVISINWTTICNNVIVDRGTNADTSLTSGNHDHYTQMVTTGVFEQKNDGDMTINVIISTYGYNNSTIDTSARYLGNHNILITKLSDF